ncbi:Uncharacterised protein [uncultured archaeon]|nr:Uncharacterised protein [uncultured archaeon]
MQSSIRPPSRIYVTIDLRTPPWIVVSGQTWERRKALGFAGLGMKWKPEKKAWEKLCCRKDLAELETWPEVALSHEAKEQMEEYRKSVALQQEYYRKKAQRKPITHLTPMTPEERAARKALIEANRLKREAAYKAREDAKLGRLEYALQ